MASAVASGSQSRHATHVGHLRRRRRTAGAEQSCVDRTRRPVRPVAMDSCGRCGWENMASHGLRFADPSVVRTRRNESVENQPTGSLFTRANPDRTAGNHGQRSAGKRRRGRHPRSRTLPVRRCRPRSRQHPPEGPSAGELVSTGTGLASRFHACIDSTPVNASSASRPSLPCINTVAISLVLSCASPCASYSTSPSSATTGTTSQAPLDDGQGLCVARRVSTVRRQRLGHLRRRLAGVSREVGITEPTFDRLRRSGHGVILPDLRQPQPSGVLGVTRRECPLLVMADAVRGAHAH